MRSLFSLISIRSVHVKNGVWIGHYCPFHSRRHLYVQIVFPRFEIIRVSSLELLTFFFVRVTDVLTTARATESHWERTSHGFLRTESSAGRQLKWNKITEWSLVVDRPNTPSNPPGTGTWIDSHLYWMVCTEPDFNQLITDILLRTF